MNNNTYNSEICLKKYVVYAPSISTFVDTSGTIWLCLWILYFEGPERNSFNFLTFVHIVSTITGIAMILTFVESPYWLIKQAYSKVS